MLIPKGILKNPGESVDIFPLFYCVFALIFTIIIINTFYIVIERLKFNPKPSKKIMELGQGSKIQCRAQGYDTPVVKWFKVRNFIFYFFFFKVLS